jgi:hypothetical protein
MGRGSPQGKTSYTRFREWQADENGTSSMRKLNTKLMGTSRRRSTPVEFEMAHQFAVATDGIRFALKHTELYCPRSDRFARLAPITRHARKPRRG